MRKFGIKSLKYIGLSLFLGVLSQSALAIQEGWYLGGGYGATHLDPEVPFDIFKVSEHQSELSRVTVGYDVDQLASIELSVSDLGEALLTNEDTVAYTNASIAGLYRIYDSQYTPYSNQDWGLNLYAKLGLGYLNLESETALDSESRVHMLVGAGVEFAMIGGLSLRTEFEFLDTDALAANVSLLKRFRFAKRQPERILNTSSPSPRPVEKSRTEEIEKPDAKPVIPVPVPKPVPVVAVPVAPKPQPVQVETISLDRDADGVADKVDQCLDSKVGYPVRANGCGMLNGVLSSLKFAKYSSELTEQAKGVLRGLANLLNKYPIAAVRMGAHTANEGSQATQIALTRDRIRAIGVYLSKQGVSSKRIKYIAYGAKVPLKGRATDRIDIKELN